MENPASTNYIIDNPIPPISFTPPNETMVDAGNSI
jgi:hypothetical protein